MRFTVIIVIMTFVAWSCTAKKKIFQKREFFYLIPYTLKLPFKDSVRFAKMGKSFLQLITTGDTTGISLIGRATIQLSTYEDSVRGVLLGRGSTINDISKPFYFRSYFSYSNDDEEIQFELSKSEYSYSKLDFQSVLLNPLTDSFNINAFLVHKIRFQGKRNLDTLQLDMWPVVHDNPVKAWFIKNK